LRNFRELLLGSLLVGFERRGLIGNLVELLLGVMLLLLGSLDRGAGLHELILGLLALLGKRVKLLALLGKLLLIPLQVGGQVVQAELGVAAGGFQLSQLREMRVVFLQRVGQP